MDYRLGFDLGFTSIGWSVILLSTDLKPIKVEDFGVRIFSSGREPKTNEPKSVERRNKRGARRNHDRYIMRRKTLLNYMIEKGLQPVTKGERTKLAQTNPYQIRNNAVDGKVSLLELGRALFHINQRRGFKSNLIADKAVDDKEKKGLKKGIDDLESVLKSTGISLGQYFYLRLEEGKSTRMKAHNNEYEIYTNRAMYQDEVDQILDEQKKHYPDILKDEVIERLKEIIFYQRPLKVQEPGYCTLLEKMYDGIKH